MEAALQGAIELIPGKFYWTSRSSIPPDSKDTHYFSTDDRLIYEPFFSDFGPLNLSLLYRYCQLVREKLYGAEMRGKKIVHVTTAADVRTKTNAAWLAGGYLVCYEDWTGEAAWRPFAVLPSSSFTPFRDASQGPCMYDVTLCDCFRALFNARRDKCFDFAAFDPDEYEKYEKVEHGDFNVISDKFIAFSSPVARKSELCPGVYTFTPSDYVQLFRPRGVTAIIRLNKTSIKPKEDAFDSSSFLANMTPLRFTLLLAFVALCSADIVSTMSSGELQSRGRTLRRADSDMERYPSPTGRGSRWRFDLGQVNDAAVPGFVGAPPTPSLDLLGGRTRMAHSINAPAGLRSGSDLACSSRMGNSVGSVHV